jgi:hypothetical protein
VLHPESLKRSAPIPVPDVALDRGGAIEEARGTAGHTSIQATSVCVHARPGSSTSDYLPE